MHACLWMKLGKARKRAVSPEDQVCTSICAPNGALVRSALTLSIGQNCTRVLALRTGVLKTGPALIIRCMGTQRILMSIGTVLQIRGVAMHLRPCRIMMYSWESVHANMHGRVQPSSLRPRSSLLHTQACLSAPGSHVLLPTTASAAPGRRRTAYSSAHRCLPLEAPLKLETASDDLA